MRRSDELGLCWWKLVPFASAKSTVGSKTGQTLTPAIARLRSRGRRRRPRSRRRQPPLRSPRYWTALGILARNACPKTDIDAGDYSVGDLYRPVRLTDPAQSVPPGPTRRTYSRARRSAFVSRSSSLSHGASSASTRLSIAVLSLSRDLARSSCFRCAPYRAPTELS